jgi:RNA polymerase sigma factor (sigma-70 family)
MRSDSLSWKLHFFLLFNLSSYYLLQLLKPISSLDLSIDDRDLLSSSNLSDLDRMEQESVASLIAVAFQSLTAREAEVLQLRYGFDDDDKNLAEIAQICKLSRQRIRQIQLKAIDKIRNLEVRQTLEDLLF